MVSIDGTLFAQIVNFIVLVILIRVFVYKPVVKVMHEREAKIAHSIDAAARDAKEAQELLTKYKAQLEEARAEAQEIVDKALKRAQDEYNAAVNNTKQEIEEMKATAKKEIEQEREQAALQLKGEIVTLSLMAANKVIAANMDSDKNKKLVSDFVDKLDENKLGGLSC